MAPDYSHHRPSSINIRCTSVTCDTISLDWQGTSGGCGCGCDDFTYFYLYDGSTIVGGTTERCYNVVGFIPCSFHQIYVVGVKQGRCGYEYVYSNILPIQMNGQEPVCSPCGPEHPVPPRPYYPQPPCSPSPSSPWLEPLNSPCPPQPCYPQPQPYYPPGGQCCPFAPSDLSADVQQAVSINLSWHGNNGGSNKTRFHVLQDYCEVAVTNETYCQIGNLCPDRQYTFCVYAEDHCGNWSPSSNVVTVYTKQHHCC